MTNELYSEILTNLNNLKFDNRSAYEYFGAMRGWLMAADVGTQELQRFNQMLLKEVA
jgi:hypothetical protein